MASNPAIANATAVEAAASNRDADQAGSGVRARSRSGQAGASGGGENLVAIAITSEIATEAWEMLRGTPRAASLLIGMAPPVILSV
jgi:hypothetical protein